MFGALVTGEDMRAKLLASRWTALLVDADPEETTVLELRLIEQGFEVKTARTIADATRLLSAGNVDLVVSEVDMPQGDGLALLQDARKQPWGKDVLGAWLVKVTPDGSVSKVSYAALTEGAPAADDFCNVPSFTRAQLPWPRPSS